MTLQTSAKARKGFMTAGEVNSGINKLNWKLQGDFNGVSTQRRKIAALLGRSGIKPHKVGQVLSEASTYQMHARHSRDGSAMLLQAEHVIKAMEFFGLLIVENACIPQEKA